MTPSRKQGSALVRGCRRSHRAAGKSAARSLLPGLAVAAALMLSGEVALGGYVEGMEAFSRGDYLAAYDELRPVAESGDPNAQFTLGFMYDYGQGVRQSTVEAIWWYRKAAEQGLAVAQFTLGSIFEAGRGTAKDLVEAYRWYSLAAENLPDGEIRVTVAERRDLIGASLSPSEYDEAQDLLTSMGMSAQSAVPAAPSSETSAPADTTADVDRRLLISEVRAELARLGYDVGGGEGGLDEITVSAIKAFQQEQGLDVTGRPSSALLKVLRTADGLAPAAPPESAAADESGAADTVDAAAEPVQPVETSLEAPATETAAAVAEPVAQPDAPPEAEVAEDAVVAQPASDEADLAVAAEVTPEVTPVVAPESSDGEPVAAVEATSAEVTNAITEEVSPVETDEQVADDEQVAAVEPDAAPTEQQIAAIESETDALPAETPAARSETATPAGPPVELVRNVQTELTRLGYRIGTVDGVAGRRTSAAIEDFQATHGLAVTGQVSEDLLTSLAAADPAVLPLPDEPDPATLARRETIDQQLGTLRAITETVDGPAAAMPGWGQLEVWEIETADLLRTRFGASAAEGLAKQRKDLVLGDPYGNFQRTAEAYRVYLASLRQDLE